MPVLWWRGKIWSKRAKTDFVWGGDALINYKYYARAVGETGKKAYTLVDRIPQHAFSREDFDLVYDDLAPTLLSGTKAWSLLRGYAAALHIMKHAAVYHMSYTGGPLRATPLRWFEASFFRIANVKTVVSSFGSDFWRYSLIIDGRVKQAMMLNYKEMGRLEPQVDRQVRYWVKNADIVVGTTSTDGLGYWDCMISNPVCVNVEAWPVRTDWSEADGVNAPVKIVHAPNHRGVKGTEFFLASVDRLRADGLKIEFVLLERMPNPVVLDHLRTADICLDQCASGMGYGLFAIESMASGSVVIGNLEDPYRIDLHRQYCYMQECPLVSTDVERLLFTLRLLVGNPSLRRTLGQMGREFVNRYHSGNAMKYYFSLLYRKLLDDPDLDIALPFHPLLSDYSNQWKKLAPPLHRNRLY